MEDYRVCAICMQDMRNRKPRALPCLHSYCTECLQQLWMTNQSVLVCPSCRKKVKLPSQGVGALPINFLLSSTEQEVANRERTCTICKTKPVAIVYCRDCQKDLCHTCRKKHNAIPALQNHTLKNINPDFCSEHKEAIEYYCDFCDTELCSSCILTSHSEHGKDIFVIKQRCEQLKDTISNKSLDMQRHLGNKLSHLDHVEERNKFITKEITGLADQIIKTVNQRKELLIRDLKKNNSEINKIKVSIKKHLDKMEKANEVCTEERYDSDFYSLLRCLDVNLEHDVDACRNLCHTSVPIRMFTPETTENISLGKLQSTSEDLDIYPVPKYEDNPYDLDKISVCTDTIYELFLSRKRADGSKMASDEHQIKQESEIENIYEEYEDRSSEQVSAILPEQYGARSKVADARKYSVKASSIKPPVSPKPTPGRGPSEDVNQRKSASRSLSDSSKCVSVRGHVSHLDSPSPQVKSSASGGDGEPIYANLEQTFHND